MKLLVMTLLNLDYDLNGVVVSAKEHISLVTRNRWNVVLVTPYTQPGLILNRLLFLGSALFRRTRWSWVTLINLTLKAFMLIATLRRTNIKDRVLHAHDVLSAGVLLVTSSPNQLIFLQSHFHSSPWDEFQQAGLVKENSLSKKVLRLIFHRILRHQRLRFLPTSQANKQFLGELLSVEPKVAGVIYPGISTERFAPTTEQPYLINVGSIDSRKNQILLVDMLKELENDQMGMPLYLIGPIDSTEKLRIQKRVTELGVRSDIHFSGVMTSEKTREFMAGAQLYIHTAHRESFGRTLVEAMACHTPVVALDYPAVHEILDPSAIIPRNWSPADMAQFIATLLASPSSLADLQQRQHQKFNLTFTEARMFNTYVKSIRSQGGYHV